MGQLSDAGNTTTLPHYLDLLDTAGLLAGIGKYSGDRIRKRASSPKFQVYNTALIGAHSESSFREASQDTMQWGRIVESVVGAHLLTHAPSSSYTVHYWREGDNEVDYVFERQGKVIGIEVKSGNAGATASAAAFQRQTGADRCFLVGESGIPWSEFLLVDPGELF